MICVNETELPDRSAILLSAVYLGVLVPTPVSRVPPLYVPRVNVSVSVVGFHVMVELTKVVVEDT